jgi:hypothetical protein
VVGLAGLDYHCLCNVEIGMVGMFRTTVGCWRVMNCKVADCTLMFKVVCKFLFSVLSSSVTSKNLDYSPSLYLSPCFVMFVVV